MPHPFPMLEGTPSKQKISKRGNLTIFTAILPISASVWLLFQAFRVFLQRPALKKYCDAPSGGNVSPIVLVDQGQGFLPTDPCMRIPKIIHHGGL